MAERNPFIGYFEQQAKSGQVGGGIRGFVAPRYQAGFGFSLASFMPFLKSAGKTLLDSGVGLGKDLIEGELTKDNVLGKIRKRGISAAKGLAEDACDELKRRNQTGGGAKRSKKKKTTSDPPIKTKKKTKSSSELKKLLASLGGKVAKKKRKKKVEEIEKKKKKPI